MVASLAVSPTLSVVCGRFRSRRRLHRDLTKLKSTFGRLTLGKPEGMRMR